MNDLKDHLFAVLTRFGTWRIDGEMRTLFKSDLEQLVSECGFALDHLSGKTWLITGGTGFFGKWLTQALCGLLDQRKREGKPAFQLIMWTRNAASAQESSPWLKGRPEIQWFEGDIRAQLPEDLHFDGIIHGATAASAALNDARPGEMFDVILEGTRNVLRMAKQRSANDLLFISSGGVYGPQPLEMTHIPETFLGAPTTMSPASAYGEGKRAAEFLCTLQAQEFGTRVLMARCFAFVGPYLPLDTHFAVGNFMNDVLKGRDIQIGGDGTPYRSYLYGTDLTKWLLKILSDGKSLTPYHVGSESDLSIRELAELVAEVGEEVTGRKRSAVHVAKTPPPGHKPARYVPSTAATRRDLVLSESVSLREGIARTLRWNLEK